MAFIVIPSLFNVVGRVIILLLVVYVAVVLEMKFAESIVVAPPLGITKFNTALDVVPEFVTLALVPGAPVVVVPTVTVAELPEGPCGPGTGI